MSRQEWFQEMPEARAAVRAMEEEAERERLPRVMDYLDRHGATFEAVPRWPGWYQARWSDEAISNEPRRWACCTDFEADIDWPYALAFKARVETGAQS